MRWTAAPAAQPRAKTSAATINRVRLLKNISLSLPQSCSTYQAMGSDGIYCAVLTEGMVRAGDPIVLLDCGSRLIPLRHKVTSRQAQPMSAFGGKADHPVRGLLHCEISTLLTSALGQKQTSQGIS